MIKMEQNEKEMVDKKIHIAKLEKEVEEDKKKNKKETDKDSIISSTSKYRREQ